MNSEEQEKNEVLATLYSLKTIRERAHHILDLAKQDKLTYFAFNEDKMIPTASYIMEVIQRNYPTLEVPYHSRWRHFEADGVDRMSSMWDKSSSLSSKERGTILYELVIISVFLDAGAGAKWRYLEQSTGTYYSRSEGLAIASLELYQSGAFSAVPDSPYRIDASKLVNFTEAELKKGFQVSENNPLEGIQGRISLLNQLGKIIKKSPQYFGAEGRLGDFYSYILSLSTNNTIDAEILFDSVLYAFNQIWPTRLNYQGVSLGDVWLHSKLKTQQPGSEYMPFHKLSQWLTYSLIEPLEQAGIRVMHIDKLTGLPEYRNGGLLIDTGLLSLKNRALLNQGHEPGSELVVEWRALTVALLDELAQLIREQLNKSKEALPLAKILQGGTWEAGRQIAKQKREGGVPPLHIISDGTVF